ncbi:MAG: hypothetical protein NT013_26625 [Planctomycetia bacterium]|nr:hypothetical protein [Planctomycetia bacterium]
MIATTRDTQKKSLDKISGQLVFLNVSLMAFERNQGGRSLWNQVHRCVQTIRATCEQANLADLKQLASDLEDLVRLIGDGIVESSTKNLALVRSCTEVFECGVDSVRIGVPISYEFEEVRFELHQTLIESSLSAASC